MNMDWVMSKKKLRELLESALADAKKKSDAKIKRTTKKAQLTIQNAIDDKRIHN